MSGDGLRDELGQALVRGHTQFATDPTIPHMGRHLADAVLPIVQAHIDAARGQVAEQIAQAIEAEYVDSPWIRTAIDIARRHAKGDIDGWLEQRDAAVARAEAAEQALRELVTLKDGPRDADYERRKPLAWEAARRALDGTP